MTVSLNKLKTFLKAKKPLYTRKTRRPWRVHVQPSTVQQQLTLTRGGVWMANYCWTRVICLFSYAGSRSFIWQWLWCQFSDADLERIIGISEATGHHRQTLQGSWIHISFVEIAAHTFVCTLGAKDTYLLAYLLSQSMFREFRKMFLLSK